MRLVAAAWQIGCVGSMHELDVDHFFCMSKKPTRALDGLTVHPQHQVSSHGVCSVCAHVVVRTQLKHGMQNLYS